ncbi:hypothetical protein CW745_12365 [Psychromonas sp. psych-6C06]|uniref:peptidoglycan binding protein CsiV n=1 Tax=Psychromonas sp. psych-6C06 TaxID=2058089 RepID=UPI000C33541B|nr:peptidoglycan binding protein CsiV [Psychromonas sp. psych-6C06]PKF61095.1 hypothetical protein CW745_12365 [Psychromonas sp. psych-6C06]
MNYKILIALFLASASLTSQAEQRWFEVELLVFERNTPIQDINEHLSSQEIVVDTGNSISILNAEREAVCVEGETCLSKANPTVITKSFFDAQGNNFRRLDSSQLQLIEQREKLKKHANFNPVLHMVWQMPVESGRTAKPLHLFAGKNLAEQVARQKQAEHQLIDIAINTSDAQPTENLTAEALSEGASDDLVSNEIITDKWAIDGNFKIYLDHYLFIDSQLIIRKAVTESIPQIAPSVELIDDENDVQIAKQVQEIPQSKQAEQRTVVKEILFDQNRRLRSEEIHYLDHPLMGIIVQIRKIPKQR